MTDLQTPELLVLSALIIGGICLGTTLVLDKLAARERRRMNAAL